MSHSMRRVRNAAVALLVLIGATLVATPPATAAEMRVAIRADGAVQARGAAMVVMATVTCDPDTTFFPILGLQVTQRLANGEVVHGMGAPSSPLRCTGSPQVLRIAVRARGQFGEFSTFGLPFAATSAFVTASLLDCNETCDGVSASRTVKLAREVPTFSRPRAATNRSRIYLDAATATLEAGGAGVTVRIPYKCSPTVTSATLDIALLERTSIDAVTGADAFTDVACTGLKRIGVAVFHADTAPWRQGSAYLILSGGFCTALSECERPYAHTTVAVTAPTT